MSDTIPSASAAEPTTAVEDLSSSASAAEPTTATPPAVATTYRGRRIRQLEQERDDLMRALRTVLTTGKSYNLANSHAVTRADVPEIESRLSAVNQELAELMMRRPFSTLRREPTKFF